MIHEVKTIVIKKKKVVQERKMLCCRAHLEGFVLIRGKGMGKGIREEGDQPHETKAAEKKKRKEGR